MATSINPDRINSSEPIISLDSPSSLLRAESMVNTSPTASTIQQTVVEKPSMITGL